MLKKMKRKHTNNKQCQFQRWNPQGRFWPRVQILKSLALASRTDFEVLGLGREASSSRKLPCPRLENSTIF